MKRANDIEKLLGGWAAGTLTEAERRALMEAALEDQALFDRLAGEQLLKETLEDPALRARIYAAAREHRGGLWEAVWRRPWTWGVGMAAASVLIFSAVRWQQMAAYRAVPVQRAPVQAVEPAPPAAASPAAAAPEQESPAAEPRRAGAPRQSHQPRQFDVATIRPKIEPAVVASPPALPAAAPAAALRQSALPQPSAELAPAPPPASVPARAPAAADAAKPIVGGVAGGVIGGIISPSSSPAERKETAAKSAQAGTRVLLETAAPRAALGLARVPASAALVLKCRVLRRDRDGSYVQADPGKPFRPDDSLRLAFEVNDRAQVSVATPVGVLWTGTVNRRREESVSIPAGTTRLVITASRGTPAAFVRSPAPAGGENVGKGAGAVQVSRTAAPSEGAVVTEITLKYE